MIKAMLRRLSPTSRCSGLATWARRVEVEVPVPSALGVVKLCVHRTFQEHVEGLLPQSADAGLKEENRPCGDHRDHCPPFGQKLGESIFGLGLQLLCLDVLPLAIGGICRSLPPMCSAQVKALPLPFAHAKATGTRSERRVGPPATAATWTDRVPTRMLPRVRRLDRVVEVECPTRQILRHPWLDSQVASWPVFQLSTL